MGLHLTDGAENDMQENEMCIGCKFGKSIAERQAIQWMLDRFECRIYILSMRRLSSLRFNGEAVSYEM